MPNIGKYEIESRIGHGGMGDVYRAYDPLLRRRVAIKVLKVGDDPETLSRFRLEATSAGNLNHPNIVTIHDYGDFEGEPFLVMEYLEGQDLQRAVESGRKFDLVEITDIMSQVADALECAHQHGVIHRDVKPANIMLLNRGGVKLMDFGIARLAGSNTQQTKIGHLVGTVLYMSPEQFHNLELDRRVDIWAFGVIYWQLLAGKHPFQMPDQLVTMYNIANKPAPPICSVNREIPEALGQIVDRCLSKDRDQRYPSMEDLRFDALPVLQDLSKQQAARMLGEARDLMEKADWDGAQTLVRRVLELDPADRSAHALRKTIADAVKKRETAPRVESLAAAAEQFIASRQYAKAIETLETAIRFDPSAEHLRKRADYARELVERERRAAEALQAAKQAFDAGNLTDAHQYTTHILSYDPGHAEGSRFMAAIQEEMARRERKKLLEDGLARGRELMRNASFDEAVKVLQELTANLPGTLEAAQLLREAEAAREDDRRRRALNNELAGVKDLLRALRFPEAVQRLEAISAQFSGEEEVHQLLRYAREEWKVRQRAEALERAKEHIVKLQNECRFEEAMHFLERAKQEFPSEPDLLRLAQAVAAAKAEFERRAALEQLMQEARAKQRAGEFTASLRVVDLGLQQYGPDENLLVLHQQLEREWQIAQRNLAFQKAIAEGRQLTGQREWEKAIAHFEQLTRQYPEEQEPRKLLAEAQASLQQAEDALKREQRERAEQEALARAAALENANQRESALAEIEAGLRLYPDSEPLAQTKARLVRDIDEKRKTREREIKLEEVRRRAEAEQQRRAYEAEQAALAKRRELTERLEAYLAKAYQAIGQGDLSRASKMLVEARKIDSTHPGISRAQTDLDAEKARMKEPITARFPAGDRQEPERQKFPLKGVLIGSGAAVAVLAGAFFWFHQPPPPPPIATLEVSPQAADLATPARIALKGAPGLQFLAKGSDPWIAIEPQDGPLPATIVLTARPEGLAPGKHTGSVEVTAGKSTEHVTVNFTVASAAPKPPDSPPPTPAQPELRVSPEFLIFEHKAGSPDPPTKFVYVTGAGRYQASLRNTEWASIIPSSGKIPGQISVAVHPGNLSPGSHTNQLTVTLPDAPGAQKIATIRLVITEAPLPPVSPPVAPPEQKPPTPTPAEVKCTTGNYLGRLNGDLVWHGTLPPNGKIVITPGGVVDKVGDLNGPVPSIPRLACFDVTVITPSGVRASTAASMLTLVNVSGAPVSTITIHWTVK
jgi:Protein kinase domain